MKTLQKISLLAVLACSSFAAQAHRMFLVPSSTVVSGKSAWVTVDAAAATNVFEFDHVALKLDGLQITAPDGQTIKPENAYSGRYRSSFDVALNQTGSYKISLLGDTLFATYLQNGETKRWRGNAAELEKAIPADASDVKISQRLSRVETFVSNGKPGGSAMQLSGKGLELQAITHPNDLVSGETASFRMMLNGQPAAGITVELIAGGLRYRQQLNEQRFTTDADGKFSIRFPAAGLYWLAADAKDNSKLSAPVSARSASYVATLEVLPE